MALHDFRCPDCGTIREVNVPISIGASRADVTCPCCEGDLGWLTRMEPIPGIGRMSVFSDADSRNGSKDFAKTTIQVEDPRGGFRNVTVGSLSDIRRLERESEQAERDGVGRRMVWRDYSQDHSNGDKHTLGEDPSMKPAKHYTNGQPVTVRKGDPVIADHGTVEG